MQALYLSLKIVSVSTLCCTGAADVPEPGANSHVISAPVNRVLLADQQRTEFHFYLCSDPPPSFL